MTDPRTNLAGAVNAVRLVKPGGVREILASLHRSPELSDQVSLETHALAPFLWLDTQGWRLTSLLVNGGPRQDTVSRPWAAVTWAWPDGDLINFASIDEYDLVSIRSSPLRWELPATDRGLIALYDAIDNQPLTASAPSGGVADQLLAAALPSPAPACYSELLSLASSSDRSDANDEAFGSVTSGARRVLQMAESYELNGPADHLRAGLEERNRPGFRIAVIGEFNRGKSTLVNQLLGHEILPTGPTPVTRAITVVGHGAPESMILHWADGRREERAISADAWADLTVDAELETDNDRTTPAIELTIDAPHLAALDTRLIDTPGTEESMRNRFVQIRRAVAMAELVIMAVSATSPFSQTEMQLLQDEVIARHVPRVLVAVTRLDAVSDPEEILRTIAGRVNAVAPNTPVLPAPGLDPSPAAVEQLWTRIRHSVQPELRREMRDTRLALQTREAADAIFAVATAALDARASSQTDRKALRRRHEAEMRNQESVWSDLIETMEDQQRKLQRAASTLIRERFEPLYNDLTTQLHHAPNMKAWWERDLPHRLQAEVRSAAVSLDGFIRPSLSKDTEWLDRQMRSRFNVAASQTTDFVMSTAAPVGLGTTVENLHQKRRSGRSISALGTVGGAILGLTLTVGAPMVVFTVLGGTAAGKLWDSKIDELEAQQQADIRRRLATALDAATERFEGNVRTDIARAYDATLRDLRAKRDLWSTSQRRAIDELDLGKATHDWEALVADLRSMRGDVAPEQSVETKVRPSSPKDEY